jgi:hypothetical protein
MRGKKFDEYMVIELAKRRNLAKNRQECGEVVKWFIDMTGVSKSTVYAILKQIDSGLKYTDIANRTQNRRPRKSELETAQEKKDISIISAIKRRAGEDKKWIPTERAIEIAENMGLVQSGIHNRHKIDRGLRRYGLNRAMAGKRKAAHRLVADYPSHVMAVDATPIDCYYMRLDGMIVPYDAPAGDKHMDDYLNSEHLYKIWVYYAVDMYSKGFLVRPFASTPRCSGSKKAGENSEDWLTFLKWCFMPKRGDAKIDEKKSPLHDCPIEGAPAILFCDRGSGIGRSNLIRQLCLRLGIRTLTHLPGNPSAKGVVEARISAFKRSFESQINPKIIKDINQLIWFYQSWADYWNRTRGAYESWKRGIKHHAIRQVTEKNLHDATISHTIRTINGYGCISIDGADWFVSYEEKHIGQKVKVYRPISYNGEVNYMVEMNDGTIIQCTNGIPWHGIDDIKSYPDSTEHKNIMDARVLSKQIGDMMIFEDILPGKTNTNIVNIPSPSKPIETHSPMGPQVFTDSESAMQWILNQSGLFVDNIPRDSINTITGGLKLSMENMGYIPYEMAVSFANLLIEYKKTKTEALYG